MCHESKVGLLLKQASDAPVLKTIITLGKEVSAEDRKLANETGISVYTFSEVEVRHAMPPWMGVDLFLSRPWVARNLWSLYLPNQVISAPSASLAGPQVGGEPCNGSIGCVAHPAWQVPFPDGTN